MNIGNLLFSTHGRINRGQWWLGNLIAFVAVKLVIYITHISIPLDLSIAMFSLHNLTIGLLLGFLYFYIHICLHVKRWHDLGKPAYYTILNYIPLIGFLISVIVLGFIVGNKDSNEYGEET